MDYSELLNKEQLAAVSTDSQYVLVIAGAGSGKTRVLTYRISWLIGEEGVAPERLLAFAFTNKVADEMKTRALALLPGPVHALHVSTFHSFCARFLRREIAVLGYPTNYTILDEDDQKKIIQNLAVESGRNKSDDIVRFTLSFIDHEKCRGHYPSDVRLPKFPTVKEEAALTFFQHYEERKNKMHALDFDDLLLKTIQILEKYPEIKTDWQRRFDHILIDEFQDVNQVQYKLVKLLARDDTSLYVVGDPDQTIYTWRGADQNIIMNFARHYPTAEKIILARNYRSTATILTAANTLIAHNDKRYKKDLYTRQQGGEPIVHRLFYTNELEASFIAGEIERLRVMEKDFHYHDVAILYRASYLTLVVEKELMRRRIPYRIYGSVKFFERKEVKDVLAYLRLLVNPRDDVSFERIVNTPHRGFGKTSLSILQAECRLQGLPYLIYLDRLSEFKTALKPRNLVALTFLLEKIRHTRELLLERPFDYPSILEEYIRGVGLFDQLSDKKDEEIDRLANVKELFRDISSFASRFPEATYENYLENATLQSAQDELTDGDFIALMTIHVAKGLEFPYVFLFSLNDGIFPSDRTLAEAGKEGLEEERRLCYVAFTRAKKRLYLTCNGSYAFVHGRTLLPSRFFKEAGMTLDSAIPLDYRRRRISLDKRMMDDDDFEADPPSLADLDLMIGDLDTKPAQPFSTNDVTDWVIGDLVEHDSFGPGVVLDIEGKGLDMALVIRFERDGNKMIMARHHMLHRRDKGQKA